MAARTPADVQTALDELGVDIQVEVHEESTATAEEAAEAAGCELGQIAKSLCFSVNGEPVLIITAGDKRVDDRKVGRLYDVSRKKVRLADFETTTEVTGYHPGGVPPVGHAQPIPILIDSTLGRYETIFAAAGSPQAIFPIPFDTLVAITGGTVADIAQD
jgi:prolyl-tRNA editing enzyme YbaK/EbsC (Cys-tRNA(Pro) deacylase)